LQGLLQITQCDLQLAGSAVEAPQIVESDHLELAIMLRKLLRSLQQLQTPAELLLLKLDDALLVQNRAEPRLELVQLTINTTETSFLTRYMFSITSK
jgi:hypothetical protein